MTDSDKTMSKTYQNLKTLMGGDVLIYQRTGSKTGVWNCTIKIPKTPRERFSTGLKDYDQAVQVALNKYQFLRSRLEENLPVSKLKWSDLFGAFMKARPRITYSRFNDAYFDEWFGQIKDMRLVTTDSMADYWEWRINYWLDEENLKRKASESKNAMYHISRKPCVRTLKHEANALRNVFQFGRNEGLLNKIPLIEVPLNHPNVEDMNKRGWFSEEDYVKLVNELRCRADPTGAFGINRVKLYHRKPHQHPQQYLCWLRLRLAVLMMANCGIRPSELVRLRWSDIKRAYWPYSKENPVMIPFVYVNIGEKVSKVRKARESYFRNAEQAWHRVQQYRDLKSKFEPRIIDDDELIFASYRNKNKAANLSSMFRKLLDDLDIRVRDGKVRTLYSLRSYYITYQLTHNKMMQIHLLAAQCGTSTRMIENHYSKIITRSFKQHFIETMRDDHKRELGIIE